MLANNVSSETVSSAAQPLRNRFDRSEWAGAFGDLGTLIPFVVGYITFLKLDPLGVLFTFGMLLILSGFYYRTPIPIQPMKAIGGTVIIQAASITPGMLWGAGLFTGLFWLTMGLTGVLDLISRIMTKPVIRGIVLGLGLSFIMEGIRMMQSDFFIALIALCMTLLLLTSKRIPAMFALIVFGVAAAIMKTPGIVNELAAIHVSFSLPHLALTQVSWQDFIKGTLILGIPQIPLTLGNAVIAITAENNRLFPQHPVTERKMAISTGIMNLISPLFGGIPMCHGAGGMAGHVRFGARTGGSLIILGTLLLVAGVFFSSSFLVILKFFPLSVLGVILFFAGLELAVSARDVGREREDYCILLVTAGFSIWNMGAGLLAGVLIQELLKRRIFKV
ncbi:MAG TPA: sulfate transporter [Pelotomaculum sp.]|nr:sulfate transporter [Pelotomaculum sp.]